MSIFKRTNKRPPSSQSQSREDAGKTYRKMIKQMEVNAKKNISKKK